MASASGGGPSQDKTVNKVALCSAIFAGFAYVGYSVVRTAFHRRRREGDGKVVSYFTSNEIARENSKYCVYLYS